MMSVLRRIRLETRVAEKRGFAVYCGIFAKARRLALRGSKYASQQPCLKVTGFLLPSPSFPSEVPHGLD